MAGSWKSQACGVATVHASVTDQLWSNVKNWPRGRFQSIQHGLRLPEIDFKQDVLLTSIFACQADACAQAVIKQPHPHQSFIAAGVTMHQIMRRR